MARNKSKPKASLPAAPKDPVSETEQESESSDEDNDQEEEEEEEEEQDSSDLTDDDGTPNGHGKTISSVEDVERLRGFDSESQMANVALESSMMNKSKGVKIPFNAVGSQKYDAASHFFRQVSSNARVVIEQEKPVQGDVDVVPLSSFPGYLDIFTLLRNRYWKGDDARYKWTIYTRGHAKQACDYINFVADAVRQVEYNKMVETEKRAAALSLQNEPPPAPVQPPQQQAPSQPQPSAPASSQYPGQYPQGQFPQAQSFAQQQQPFAQPFGMQQQPMQQPMQPIQQPMQMQHAMGQPGLPQQWGGAPMNPYMSQQQSPTIPISFSPNRPRIEPEEEVDEPPEQEFEEQEEEIEDESSGQIEELKQQIGTLQSTMEQILSGQQQRQAPQESLPPMTETMEIHRPRPIHPRTLQNVHPQTQRPQQPPAAPLVAASPAAASAAISMADWQQLLGPRGADPNTQAMLGGLVEKFEMLRQTVVEERNLRNQQLSNSKALQQLQTQLDGVNACVSSLYQAMQNQAQQIASYQDTARQQLQQAAEMVSAAVKPAPPAPPAPTPVQQVSMPQQAPPDRSQLGFFAQQPQPPSPPPPPPPPVNAQKALLDQLRGLKEMVGGLQEFSMSLGMVPATVAQQQAQQAAAAAVAAVKKPEPEFQPEPEIEIPQRPSALATAAQAVSALSSQGEDDPFKIKDFGGYRAVFEKDGKLAPFLTQMFLNADNIGSILNHMQKAISEARKQGDSEARVAQMESEIRRMREREQQLLARVNNMNFQMQQQQMMPPVDLDQYINAPPPVPPPMTPTVLASVPPEDVPASEPESPLVSSPPPPTAAVAKNELDSESQQQDSSSFLSMLQDDDRLSSRRK